MFHFFHQIQTPFLFTILTHYLLTTLNLHAPLLLGLFHLQRSPLPYHKGVNRFGSQPLPPHFNPLDITGSLLILQSSEWSCAETLIKPVCVSWL